MTELVIHDGVLSKCLRSDSDLVIPDGVKIIEAHAFNSCNIRTLTLPASVEEIDICAFYNCTMLEKVVLNEGLKTINNSAFENCKNLKDINFPKSLTFIGATPFKNTQWLADHAGDDIIINNLFCLFPKGKESCIIPNHVHTICGYAFEGTSIREIVISDSVKEIHNSAFRICHKLKQIELPDSIDEIKAHAFESCSKLKRIKLPQSIQKIGKCCFSHCSSLTELVFPDGLQTIEDYTCYDCTNLKHVYIPASVKEICASAFLLCDHLIIEAPKNSFAICFAKESGIPYEETTEDCESGNTPLAFPDDTNYKQICIGSYVQSADEDADREPIVWDIIEEKDDRILIMSHKCIDCWTFTQKPDPRWRRSEVRKWLNEEFYEQSFSSEEKERIIRSDCPLNGILKPTQDHVFLLNENEYKALAPSSKTARLTPFLRKKLLETTQKKHTAPYADWLLRTADADSFEWHFQIIRPSGTLGYVVCWNREPICLRPAMWIRK